MAAQRTPWLIPRLWPDSTIFVIGGGPSLRDVDLSCISGKRSIGTNQAFKAFPWVDVVYFGDCQFRADELKSLSEWRGIKVTSCGRVPTDAWLDIRKIGRAKNYGIETQQQGYISWNGNTGASAINLAWWFGAKRVVLLGFDMKPSGRKHNWHDYYPKRAKNFNPYKQHMRCWPYIARDAKIIGLEILNATPGSAIIEFPFVKLEDVI